MITHRTMCCWMLLSVGLLLGAAPAAGQGVKGNRFAFYLNHRALPGAIKDGYWRPAERNAKLQGYRKTAAKYENKARRANDRSFKAYLEKAPTASRREFQNMRRYKITALKYKAKYFRAKARWATDAKTKAQFEARANHYDKEIDASVTAAAADIKKYGVEEPLTTRSLLVGPKLPFPKLDVKPKMAGFLWAKPPKRMPE